MDYFAADGSVRKYRANDFKYDLRHGHIEYACVGYEVKLPERAFDAAAHKASHAQYNEVLDSAMLISTGSEPLNREDMLLRSDKDEWIAAEQAELAGLRKLGCWVRVPRSSATTKVLNPGWVYKDKPPAPPLPGRKKARLCCKGYAEDVRFLETFAPVVRFETVRAALAEAAHQRHSLWSCDIAQAYILAPLQPGQKVFINDPEDPKGDTVLALRRSLYGLKSSARNFNNHLHSWLTTKAGFTRSTEDYGMYTRGTGSARIVLLLYVDDVLSLCSDDTMVRWKKEFDASKGGKWDIRDYGEPRVFLGCDIDRDRKSGTISYSQHTYITNIAQRFNLTDTPTVLTPFEPGTVLTAHDKDSQRPCSDPGLYRSKIGQIMYCCVQSRPDVAFEVKELSRHLTAPTHTHDKAADRVIRYLYHTRYMGLTLGRSAEGLIGYTDANFGNCLDTRRSTSGHCFLFRGAPISWSSRLQSSVSQSTTEAEIRSLNAGTLDAMWLRRMLADLTGAPIQGPTPMAQDNVACEMWTRNPHHHAKQKHIARSELSVREQVTEFKTVSIHLVPTHEQLSDIFTKALPAPAHRKAVEQLLGPVRQTTAQHAQLVDDANFG